MEPEKISVSPSLSSTIISTVTQTGSTGPKDEDSDSKGSDESSWQAMKYTFTIFGVTFTAVGLFLLIEFGAPSVDEDGEVIEDEYSNRALPIQYVYRTLKQMNYYRKVGWFIY